MRRALVTVAAALAIAGCTTPPLSTAEATPTAAAVPATAAGRPGHFDQDGLAFDYPPSWHVEHVGLDQRYLTVLDVLGTGTGGGACPDVSPGPSLPPGSACRTPISLGPGQVMVELIRQDGPGLLGPIDPHLPGQLGAGKRFITIGGLPAIAGGTPVPDPGLDVDIALGWTLSMPTELNRRYLLNAYLEAPSLDATRAQVEALVASIAFDPPPPVLDPADAARVLSIGLASVAANDPSFACFPTVPGAVVRATVTQLPMLSDLRKPLPVTCTTTIEPQPIGLWKVTLTESWTAAADRSAGSLVTPLWLAPDGTPGQMGGGPSPSVIPYWPK